MKHNIGPNQNTDTSGAGILKKKNTRRGILFAFGAAGSFSIIPIMATLGYANNLSATMLLFYRFALAFCAFGSYCLLSRKNLRLAKKDYKYIIIVSILYCGQTFCYFSCFQFIPSAIGGIVFSVNPILVLTFGAIFLKHRVSKGKVLASLLAISGAVLVIYAPSEAIVQIPGVLLALTASSCSAVYILLNKQFTSHIETPVLTTYLAAGCTAGFFFMSAAGGTMTLPTNPTLILYILILAFFSTILGFFCFLKSVSLLNSGLVSIIGLSEPIFTIILAYLILGQMLTFWQMIGSAVLLFAIYRFEKKV